MTRSLADCCEADDIIGLVRELTDMRTLESKASGRKPACERPA